jgi:hypothetical protein
MKTIESIAMALVSMLLLGSLMFAQGTVNQRERQQQKRIADGVHDGELTQNEVKRLEKKQAKIHSAEVKARVDGEFASKERAKLQEKQNKASQEIYKEKHDEQTR